MYNLAEVFKIQEITKEQIIIKVDAKDALTVARYPFLNHKMEYITVTRGKNHVFTIIEENGSTWSFYFGKNGYTLIDESAEMLKKYAIKFIEDNNISIEYAGGNPIKATVYFNDNYKKWQLSIDTDKGHFNHWSNTATNLEEALVSFKGFVTSSYWEKKKAITGIDVWDATNPIFTLQ